MNNGIENTALGACRDEKESSVEGLKEKIRLLTQNAKSLGIQIYLIQVALFGKHKADEPDKKESLEGSAGLIWRWNADINDALKHLRMARGEVRYMMRELNIKEIKEVK